MKYPQLVPTRAVNAISDWLVSRLEQLGVEAPQIYTRLLLSLLQSSVQINDPIEFSNLETLFANRKGHNRRYLECDTDTLKKLNAVQCLREIVSSEQELVTIENLVDELFEKLTEIEQQSTDVNAEVEPPLATLSVENLIESNNVIDTAAVRGVSNPTQLREREQQQTQTLIHCHKQRQEQHHSQQQHNNRHHNHHSAAHQQQSSHLQTEPTHAHQTNSLHSSAATTSTLGTGNNKITSDLETDPKKRYFRAFPALSKEMEDSFKIWRRNAKSLTWPMVNRSNTLSDSAAANNLSQNSSLSTLSGGAVARQEDFCNRSLAIASHINKKPESAYVDAVTDLVNAGCGAVGVNGNIGVASAGVKRKSKRRRAPALAKGSKTLQNLRKSNTSASVVGNQQRHQRNSSPTYWDTDFEGCWEMGRDLIKEFFVKQQQQKGKTKRNRSTSESAAYNKQSSMEIAAAAATEDREQTTQKNNMNKPSISKASSPVFMPLVDISFCCEDDCDQTLSSMVQLGCKNESLPSRRLYERENSGSQQQKQQVIVQPAILSGSQNVDVDQMDFAQFKAKFNSSVEALWKDVEPEPASLNDIYGTNDLFSLAPSSTMCNSLPSTVPAPFKENLRHFWANYFYNADAQQQQLSNENETQLLLNKSAGSNKMDESSNSLSCSGSSGCCALNADLANTSDYYSMPSNLDDFDKSGAILEKAGAIQRDFGFIHDKRTPTATADVCAEAGKNVAATAAFWQNSIWSDNSNAAAGDTDESFYYKVWNSSKKLNNQLDTVQGRKMPSNNAKTVSSKPIQSPQETADAATSLAFSSYNISKWSEGINNVPPHNSFPAQQQQHQLRRAQLENAMSRNANQLGLDCTDASVGNNSVFSGGSSSNSGCLSSTTSSSNCSSAFNARQNSTNLGYNWQSPYGVGEASSTGNILQEDFNSWSNCNPMSLNEMYGVGGELSSTSSSSETSTSSLLSYNNKRSSQMSEAATTAVNFKPAISLLNHAPHSSGFVEYSRIKAVTGALPYVSTYSYNQRNQMQAMAAAESQASCSMGDDENLLTSERTHFHPIKNYADGHTFDICSALDVIDYERSESGYLMLDSERYLEYTRNDSFMAEDEGMLSGLAVSSAPLYAASNCEAAAKHKQRQQQQLQHSKGNEFVLKFKVSSNEIACQTEDPLAVQQQMNEQLRQMELLASKNVASTVQLQASWLPATSASMWQQQHEHGIDEVGSCVQQQQWVGAESNAAVAGVYWSNDSAAGFPAIDDNSISMANQQNLWSMCAACSDGAGAASEDYECLPANHRLRAELQLEADEIMNDLKYMQDLYIGGRNGSSSDEEDDDDDATDSVTDTDDELAGDADDDESDWGVAARVAEKQTQQAEMPQTGAYGNKKSQQATPKLDLPSQEAVLQSFNKLIADLLQRPAASFESPAHADDRMLRNADCFWYGDMNERNIWQPHDGAQHDGNLKPLQLLRQFGCIDSTDNSETARVAYEKQLNWQHEKLAAIWQQDNETAKNDKQHNEMQISKNEQCTTASSAEATRQQVSSKACLPQNASNVSSYSKFGMHNFRSAPLAAAAATPAYKRVQQFLASNCATNTAAKLKLAANRKRRHSASQNFCHNNASAQHTLVAAAAATTTNEDDFASNRNHMHNNNNNNANIADLNRYNLKLSNAASFANDIDIQKFINSALLQKALVHKNKLHATAESNADVAQHNSLIDTLEAEQPQQQQTIITCHWTTISPLPADDIMDAATTFSCLIDKNASILKHVTMLTRPLTR